MQGIIIFTLITFFISIILVLTDHYLNNEDQIMDEIASLLPGYNCGSCGFGGCADMAYNILNKGADPKRCRPMREEQYRKLTDYLHSHNINTKDIN
jgi:electron transport complex protein RnfB